MVIIAGHLLVEPAEGDAYVDAMRDLVTRARAFDGCIHLAITADSVDPDRTNTSRSGVTLGLSTAGAPWPTLDLA